MNERTLAALEFPKVLDRLASHATSVLGREQARALRPATSLADAAAALAITGEARRLLEQQPQLTVGALPDIRPAIERAAAGGVLEPAELLQIKATLETARRLRTALARPTADWPRLATLAGQIPDQQGMETAIARVLDEQGEVRDHASPTLARIRTALRQVHRQIQEQLTEFLHAPAYRSVIQDAIITIRNGRFVIPIKAEARSQIRCLVHDESASGATLFVEPLAVVDLNNRWRQLQAEEQHEIVRLLRELSTLVGQQAEALRQTVAILADLDLALAKARYAEALRATAPHLVAGDQIGPTGRRGTVLRQARHPLLTGPVVPIDLWLGDEFRVLIISGPNTGGKTVALKTLGLLTLMAQAGLQIPAAEGAQVRVFGKVFADIGDEQSIEQNLSTFSGHLRRAIEVLAQADDDTLALLDEIGVGTDPVEGAALARAILLALLERGAWVVATTHYTALKTFAASTPGMANAAVEFDPETLTPTYRLIIGVPGQSHALTIARRLGLPAEVLERAQRYLDPDAVRAEALLADLQAERRRLQAEREAATRLRQRLEETERALQARLANLEAEREQVLAQARAEVEEELRALRAQLRQAEARLAAAAPPAVAEALATVRAVERQYRRLRRSGRSVTPHDGALRVGDAVRIRSLGQVGQVIALDTEAGMAEVQVGSFKLRVRLADLERTSERPRPAPPAVPRPSPTTPAAASLEFHVRGWRAEEVVPELEKYLNQAYLAGLPYVRIVHGKGTGTLRQVVRAFLAEHPLVQSFSAADPREGGDGVTVAVLATE